MGRGVAALLTALLAGAAAAGCGGPAEEAIRADREGRAAEALRLYGEAVAAEGEEASAELLFDLGRAALLAGDLEAAGKAAARAAGRAEEGSAAAAHAAFLRGSVAAAVAAAAEREAGGDPDPRTRMRIATFYEDALVAFSAAAAGPGDAAPARRNAERALLALERMRDAATAGGPQPKGPPPPPPPGIGTPTEAPSPPPGETPTEVPIPAEGGEIEEGEAGPPAKELPAGEVLRVMDRLDALEREKAASRGARREKRGAAVERDW